jgi:hypothetical protein
MCGRLRAGKAFFTRAAVWSEQPCVRPVGDAHTPQDARTGSCRGFEPRSLLDTADELKAVAKKLGGVAGDVHLGSDASEATVKQTPLADYRRGTQGQPSNRLGGRAVDCSGIVA